MPKSPPTVFISYAREDLRAAQKLYNDLKRAGANSWLDKESLLPGQRWKVEIKRAIKRSRYFLAVLSSNSVSRRGYVHKEVAAALEILDEFPESQIFIIPVRLDDCSPSHERLRDLQWVDMFPSWNDGVEKILRAIRVQSGGNCIARRGFGIIGVIGVVIVLAIFILTTRSVQKNPPRLGPINEIGVEACHLLMGEKAQARKDAQLWTQPDVMIGQGTVVLAPGTPLVIKSGPTWGRIRKDEDYSGWWYEVEVDDKHGWLWEARIEGCARPESFRLLE
jgi:hypothetical protein